MKSQRGASLIETMIAVGILAAISYFVAGMIRNGTVGQKSLQTQDDARTITENMAAVLNDTTACGYTLTGVDPAAGSSITDIKDASGSPVYSKGKTYSTKSLHLDDIIVGGSVGAIDAKSGIQKWTPLGGSAGPPVVPPTSGTVFVQVLWSTTSPDGKAVGPAKLSKFFLVNATTLAGGKIATCVSQAAGGGGGAGYWNQASGNIYNNNTGSVLIGTQTPPPIPTALDVYTTKGDTLMVAASGQVAIGQPSPAPGVAFDVQGPVRFMDTLANPPQGSGMLVGNMASAIWLGAAAGPSLGTNTIQSGVGGSSGWGPTTCTPTSGSKPLQFSGCNGADTNFEFRGKVGIGAAPTTYSLEVSGDVQAQSFISLSDQRLKTDIRPVEGLAKVLNLRGVRFRWLKDGSDAIGLIAQEVEKVFPELVSTAKETGYKAVRYDSLIGPLIESVKELYAMVQTALARLDGHANRIAALEASNAAKDAAIGDLARRLDEQERVLRSLQKQPARP